MLPHHSRVISRNLLIRTGAFALATSFGTLCAAQQPDSPAVTPTSSGKPDSEEPSEVAPTKAECIAAHHESQAAKMMAICCSRKRIRRCAPIKVAPRCSSPTAPIGSSISIRNTLDGVRSPRGWTGQFHSQGEVDGNPVGDWARGEALKLDPGEHEVRFSLDAHAPIISRSCWGKECAFD